MGNLTCLGGLPRGGGIGTMTVGIGAGDVYVQTAGDLLESGECPRVSGIWGSGTSLGPF